MKRKTQITLLIFWLGMIFVCTQLPFFTGHHTEAILQSNISKYNDHLDFNRLNLIIRKITHITVFGILASLVYMWLRKIQFAFFLAWALTVIYAFTDEWHQSFRPGRVASAEDVMFDSFGALLALSLIFYKRKRKEAINEAK